MFWGLLAVVSAFLLGIYDIFKKVSLKDNAVIPVLFFSTLTSGVICFFFILLSLLMPELQGKFFLFVKPISMKLHLIFFVKAFIVGSSWILSYFAVKHLPVTVVGPIRSSSPVWTILGAYLIFSERLTLWQWIGVSVTLIFYYLFSFVGKKEGLSFRTNKWILYLIFATLIASVSSLYDKYLIINYDRVAMQAWYQVYMVPLMAILFFVLWYPQRRFSTKFEWRMTIPMIGIVLTVADFVYFWSLSQTGALLTIVSTIRRANVVVSFAIAAYLFKENNLVLKALCLIGLLFGIVFTIFS